MSLNPYQQVISAQVWVCDACGCQDSKSCGCNSTAHAEELAKKKSQDRERARKYRASRDAAVDNIDELAKRSEIQNDESHLNDDGSYAVVNFEKPVKMRVQGFLWRARESARAARMDDMDDLVTEEILKAAGDAAAAWEKAYRAMEQRYHAEEKSA